MKIGMLTNSDDLQNHTFLKMWDLNETFRKLWFIRHNQSYILNSPYQPMYDDLHNNVNEQLIINRYRGIVKILIDDLYKIQLIGILNVW